MNFFLYVPTILLLMYHKNFILYKKQDKKSAIFLTLKLIEFVNYELHDLHEFYESKRTCVYP